MADRERVAEVDECDLRVRLETCAATRSLANGRLTRIAGGLSNRAWRLEANGERWFLRLGHPQAALLGVDRESECALLHAVAAAGLAPVLRACEPAAGLLVTRFVEGRTWSAADAGTVVNLRRLAGRLRQLHEMPVPAGVRRVDYERQARRLAANLPQSGGAAAALEAHATAAFARIGDGRERATPCHNDLHHLNVLDDGRQLWLVDWEYGGYGDPVFDVAGFLALHDLGPGPSEAFLNAYGDLRAEDRCRLDDARWLYDYVQWLWYRTRYPDPQGDEARHAERLAQRLLRCNN